MCCTEVVNMFKVLGHLLWRFYVKMDCVWEARKRAVVMFQGMTFFFMLYLSRSTTTGEGPVHLERLQQTAHLGRDQTLGKALHLLLLSDVNGK